MSEIRVTFQIDDSRKRGSAESRRDIIDTELSHALLRIADRLGNAAVRVKEIAEADRDEA